MPGLNMLAHFVGQRFYLCLTDSLHVLAAQANIECLPYEKHGSEVAVGEAPMKTWRCDARICRLRRKVNG